MTNVKKRKNRRIGIQIAQFLFSLLVIFLVSVGGFLLFNYVKVINNPIEIINMASTKILDKDGNLYQELGGSNVENIPEVLKNAVISIEDKRYYSHNGVDLIRTVKAVLGTFARGSLNGAGGSTITQQLVKNLTKDDEISISRKVREAIYATALESKVSKEWIINRYLNIIYLGKGNSGIQSASENYFGQDVNEISLPEAAFLAAIIKSPNTYINDLDKANERKNYVLSCMLDQGMISQEDYKDAQNVYVDIEDHSVSSETYTWATESVIKSLALKFHASYGYSYSEAESKIINGGYTIYSTIDPRIQKMVENKYQSLPDSIGSTDSAMVVLTTDGKVSAICGGTGIKSGNLLFNRALQARRQPGSAIKPLAVYAPAFEKRLINSLSIYEDNAVDYNGWIVRNYDGLYNGQMTIRQAITVSNNTIPVQILNQLSPKTGIAYLQKMGFKTESKDNALTLAVGAVSVGYTPLEMASGYQCISNGGIWCEPTLFTKVIDRSGNTTTYNQEQRQIFSPETAYIITDMLKSVVNEGTGKYLSGTNFELAAKTGTTTDSKDKWLCAYTQSYVITSWFGHDIPAEMNLSSSFVQGITRSILVNLNNKASFNIPGNIEYLKICNVSGMLVEGERCSYTRTEIFDKRYSPTELCSTCTEEAITSDNLFGNSEDNFQSFFEGLFGGLFGNNQTPSPEEPAEQLETELYNEIIETEPYSDVEEYYVEEEQIEIPPQEYVPQEEIIY